MPRNYGLRPRAKAPIDPRNVALWAASVTFTLAFWLACAFAGFYLGGW